MTQPGGYGIFIEEMLEHWLSKNNLLQNFESFLGSCGIDVKLRLVTNPTGLPELYVVHDKKCFLF